MSNTSDHKNFRRGVILLLFINLVGMAQISSGMDDSVIEAIQYRIKGYVYQRQGDFSRAMECYKKAIEKCPFYACAHNDLGVLYEQKGQIELAEKEYLKATDVEPGYASAYTNLALLYEDVNKLEGACYYWQKRLEVGKSNDVWTLHAKKRFSELSDRLAEQEKAKQAESAKKIQKEIAERSVKGPDEKAVEEPVRSPEKAVAGEFQKGLAKKSVKKPAKELSGRTIEKKLEISEKPKAKPVKTQEVFEAQEASDLARELSYEKGIKRDLLAKDAKKKERLKVVCQKYLECANKYLSRRRYDFALQQYEKIKKVDPNYPYLDQLIKEAQDAQADENQRLREQVDQKRREKEEARLNRQRLEELKRIDKNISKQTENNKRQQERQAKAKKQEMSQQAFLSTKQEPYAKKESELLGRQQSKASADNTEQKLESLLKGLQYSIAKKDYSIALNQCYEIEKIDPNFPGLKSLIKQTKEAQAEYQQEKTARFNQAQLLKEQEKIIKLQKEQSAKIAKQDLIHVKSPDESLEKIKAQAQKERIQYEQKRLEKIVSRHIEKCKKYLANGRIRLAMSEYRKIQKLDPQGAVDLYTLIQLSKQAEAQKEAARYFNKGQSFYYAGKYEDATRELKASLDLNPNNSEAYRLLKYCQKRTQVPYYELEQPITTVAAGAQKEEAYTSATAVPPIAKAQAAEITKNITQEVQKQAQATSPASDIDIEKKYNIIGVVSYRAESNEINTLNQELLKKAKAMGAEEVVGVKYFQHNNFIYGYGTAVNKKK